MSMTTPAPTPRAPMFSEPWWEQWRQVKNLAVARGDKKLVRRLRTAAVVGQTCYVAGEVAYAAAETAGKVASDVKHGVRYALTVIAV